jgi:hypothetical protein
MAASQLGYTPGSGANVATDLDGTGAHHQKALIEHLQGGEPTPVTELAPLPIAAYGELIEAIEAMRFALQALTRSIGQMQPDTSARMRVNIEAGTLPAVGTVSTLTNQTQIGGSPAFEQIPALMRLGADSLRRNITVT